MKKNNTYANIFAIILLMFSYSVLAQIDDQKFVDIIGMEPSVEINLGAAMLGLLSSATKNEEQGIANILSSLSRIKVTVFELEKSNKIKSIRTEINKLARLKVSTGYEKLASIKEKDSLVYVLAKMDAKQINSISVFALDDEDELVLIDIDGTIKMSQIGDLMGHFNVDLDINGLQTNKHKEKDQ